MNDRMTTFFEGYIESIRKFKNQLSKMEYHYGARKQSISVSASVPASAPAVPFFLTQWKTNTAANLLRFISAPSMQDDE